MRERKKPKITICIDPEINKKLEEESYNKSKLIDKLLTKYFQKKDKKN